MALRAIWPGLFFLGGGAASSKSDAEDSEPDQYPAFRLGRNVEPFGGATGAFGLETLAGRGLCSGDLDIVI